MRHDTHHEKIPGAASLRKAAPEGRKSFRVCLLKDGCQASPVLLTDQSLGEGKAETGKDVAGAGVVEP
jgi:hypothetical protein